MDNRFLFIAFTRPDAVADEAAKIVELIESGFDYVHIRKPGYTSDEIEVLVSSIAEKYHPRLRLHDAYELSQRYRVGGIHLNSRHSDVYAGVHKTKSCHSISEVERCVVKGYDYVTLSPIFNSISKKDYKSNFSDYSELARIARLMPVVALGGVDSSRIPILIKTGFAGAAFLGALWGDDKDLENVEKIIKDYRY